MTKKKTVKKAVWLNSWSDIYGELFLGKKMSAFRRYLLLHNSNYTMLIKSEIRDVYGWLLAYAGKDLKGVPVLELQFRINYAYCNDAIKAMAMTVEMYLTD